VVWVLLERVAKVGRLVSGLRRGAAKRAAAEEAQRTDAVELADVRAPPRPEAGASDNARQREDAEKDEKAHEL
jgi:hypothetical protein